MRMPAAFLSAGRTRPTSVTAQPAILDVYRSEEPAMEFKNSGAAIDTSWLPWAAKTYHISPNLEDYVVKNMPICPSDVPNRNGIGFQLEELLRFQPPPVARQTYRAWAGCPVHYEHKNEDCTKALGVIFDTSLRKIKTHGNGQLYMVHGLIGVDRTKYPELAARMLDGTLNTGSMGALADVFTCSICGSQVKKSSFMNCGHVGSPDQVNWRVIDHGGERKIAHLFAHSLSPIEYSLVEDPAWVACQNINNLST